MITLDRLKLATSAKYITNLNQSLFLETSTNQGISYYKYHQDTPFSLSILQNQRIDELTIEFTGKILGDDYANLISRKTIRQCFERINTSNICKLDTDGIIKNSKVCLCDVTKDISCNFPMSEIKKHIKASIINYDKWLVRKCQNNGLEIYNSVTTKRRFKRLIIYDKYKELQRAENKEFFTTIRNPAKVMEQFKGKIRIELNLRSMEQVRKYLHVPNTDLQSVLDSTAAPILEIWDESIAESQSPSTEVYNFTEKFSLLQSCNYDLQAVEMKLRENASPSTSIRRKMESYRKLLQSIQNNEVKPMIIRDLIK